MTNPYYNLTTPTPFIPGTKVRSDEVINEYNLVAAGFDLLPANPAALTYGRIGWAGLSTGVGNTYTTLTGDSRAVDTDGDLIIFIADKTNTGASTLEVDGNGARALVDPTGVALAAGDVAAGIIYEARYDAAHTRWQLVSPTQNAAASAELAHQWAVNPYHDDVDGYPGQFSSMSWALDAAISAAAAATFDPALFVALAGAQTVTGVKDFQADQTISSYAANANARTLKFQKSRNATPGAHTIVNQDDTLGTITFYGSNGTSFTNAASIIAASDGVPGATNDMPGRLVFSTVQDGQGTLTERVRLNNRGQFAITGGGLTYANPQTVGGSNPLFAIQSQNSIAVLDSFDAGGSNPARVALRTTRGGAIGTLTISQANDAVGGLEFYGANGTGFDTLASIYGYVDGTPGASADMPGRLVFSTSTDGTATLNERMRIKNSGQVVLTHNDLAYVEPFTIAAAPSRLVVQGSSGKLLTLQRVGNDSAGAELVIAKTRSTTPGGLTIVQADDTLGNIEFAGTDGSSTALIAATILAAVDGTPGATSDMPGRLVFLTSPDGSATPLERLRVRNTGQVVITSDAQTYALPIPYNEAGSFQGQFVVQGITTAGAWIGVQKLSNDAAGGYMSFLKSRGTVPGANTIVQSGDQLGTILFYGANGAGAASAQGAYISVYVDGVPGTAGDMPGRMIFATTADGAGSPSERVRITSSGNVVVLGSTSAYATPAWTGVNTPFNVVGTDTSMFIVSEHYVNSSSGMVAITNKSRGASVGTQTVVQNNDVLHTMQFRGSDGTQFVQAANITVEVDGTPGTNDMPGRLIFRTTADGTNSPAEQMRISQTGLITAPAWPYAQKASDTSRNTTTTLTDDNELTMASVPVGRYRIEVYLEVTSASATPGFKWQITQPGGNDYDMMGLVKDVGNVFTSTFFSFGTQPFQTTSVLAGANHVVHCTGYINITVAGTVAVSWAQRVSDGNNVKLLKNSFIRLNRMTNG